MSVEEWSGTFLIMQMGAESKLEIKFLSEKFYQVQQREINPLQNLTNWCFRHAHER